MEFYEREFLVARITCGYFLFKVNDDLILRVNPPTKDQNYRAQIIFKDVYQEALIDGSMCPVEAKEMMEAQGIWNEEEEEKLKKIEKEIEDLKVDVYKSYFKAAGREIARKLVRAKEKIQQNLVNIKHSYDFSTTIGVATFARWNWIIENTTTYEDGTPYDWSDFTVQDVLLKYREHSANEDQLRELARTDPWRSMWAAGKKEGKIFDKIGSELTAEQKTLIGWSMMYDSVGESPESPPEEIVEDNDALDGWLLVQSRKRKQGQQKSVAEEMMGKHPNAKDIFIKPETEEDAARILELNDLDANRIRGRRTKQIKEKGSVSYHKFDDVQRDLQADFDAAQP